METAIGSGSISILRNGIEIGSTDDGVSRADEVLIGIQRVLADCNLTFSEIDMIATSLGPGSFTGIRIGIATGLGLKRSSSTKLVGVDALEAMSLLFPNESRVVVLPLGRGNYALQEFDSKADPGPRPSVANDEGLIHILGNRSSVRFIFNKDLDAAVAERIPTENFTVATEPLSTLIGRAALAGRGTEDVSPLYLRTPPSR
jgi:tRNA threonylcarbamoyladenosine biosynthesis protein TsaB